MRTKLKVPTIQKRTVNFTGRDEFWGKTETQEKRAWANNCI